MAAPGARLLTGGAARRLLAACLLAAGSALAQAQPAAPSWQDLSPQQQQILAPLAGEWDRLDAESRALWLGVAKRYPNMTPIGQKRTQSRIAKWAKLTPEQRAEARRKYREMRQRQDLRRKWREYQEAAPERKPPARE